MRCAYWPGGAAIRDTPGLAPAIASDLEVGQEDVTSLAIVRRESMSYIDRWRTSDVSFCCFGEVS